MGLWGGAQAVAFALGGFLGTVGVDLVRALNGSVVLSYSMVFTVEAALFVFAALLAFRMEHAEASSPAPRTTPKPAGALAEAMVEIES